MVADEGKNVFFTGAAGMRFIRTHSPLISLLFVLAYSTFFLLARYREIAVAPSYHCDPKEETCKETGCRFCDS